jgi:hypothetical protein
VLAAAAATNRTFEWTMVAAAAAAACFTLLNIVIE